MFRVIVFVLSVLSVTVACSVFESREIYSNEGPLDQSHTLSDFQGPEEALAILFKSSDIQSKQLFNSLLTHQKQLASDLTETHKLILLPGYSYEFEVESFCIDAGQTAPQQNANLGLTPARLPFWLDEILSNYKQVGISQEDTQMLIWALRSGLTYDELNIADQGNLNKIFLDAPTRFGNSEIENLIVERLSLEGLAGGMIELDKIREILQGTQRNYKEVARILAPQPKTKTEGESFWLKSSRGYFIKTVAKGYSSVQVQIYVPEENRKPQSTDNLLSFVPAEFLGIPDKGQRLVLSASVLPLKWKFVADAMVNIMRHKEEVKLSIKYPIDAVKVLSSATQAGLLTKKYYPNATNSDEGNAFKHFVWAGMSSQKVGRERAQKFLDAHEKLQNNPLSSQTMDIHNNRAGLDAADKIPKDEKFVESLVTAANTALKNGELIVNSPRKVK